MVLKLSASNEEENTMSVTFWMPADLETLERVKALKDAINGDWPSLLDGRKISVEAQTMFAGKGPTTVSVDDENVSLYFLVHAVREAGFDVEASEDTEALANARLRNEEPKPSMVRHFVVR